MSYCTEKKLANCIQLQNFRKLLSEYKCGILFIKEKRNIYVYFCSEIHLERPLIFSGCDTRFQCPQNSIILSKWNDNCAYEYEKNQKHFKHAA